jgi:hypothetical protein
VLDFAFQRARGLSPYRRPPRRGHEPDAAYGMVIMDAVPQDFGALLLR